MLSCQWPLYFRAAISYHLIKQSFGTGYDYIRSDRDGSYMRLDVRSQVKTKDGELLAMYYKGPLHVTPSVIKALTKGPGAATTDYGDSFVFFEFETGSEKYKAFESMTFCAAGHFILDSGDLIVEYKVSQVVNG